MKTSKVGLELIKSFEGCRLKAYKAVSTEKYYTIGYGHYGADVKAGMQITQTQADAYLVSDLEKFEAKVNKYNSIYNFNQNQFDALVSFAYNVGSIDGLTNNGKRTIERISEKITAYNKSGGQVLSGLTKRRAAEKKLFDTINIKKQVVVARPTLRKKSKGEEVSNLQSNLKSALKISLDVDGDFGGYTESAVKAFQEIYMGKKEVDGVYGPKTAAKMGEILNK